MFDPYLYISLAIVAAMSLHHLLLTLQDRDYLSRDELEVFRDHHEAATGQKLQVRTYPRSGATVSYFDEPPDWLIEHERSWGFEYEYA